MNRKVGDGFFEITCVHRDDIKADMNLSDKLIANITDDMMAEIADKMADDYCEQSFHDSLRAIAGKVLHSHRIDKKKSVI